MPTANIASQPNNGLYELPSSQSRPAAPVKRGVVVDVVVDALVGRLETSRVVVLAGGANDNVCDGNGGRTVAEAGVGSATVAERRLKEDCASAVLEA